jgi:hypothetical protein
MCGMGVTGTFILIALPNVCQRIGIHGEGLLLCLGVFSLGLGMALMSVVCVWFIQLFQSRYHSNQFKSFSNRIQIVFNITFKSL